VQTADDPLTRGIGDQQTPLFVRVSWALINLILMILDVLIMLVLLVTYLRKRKEAKREGNRELTVNDGSAQDSLMDYDYKMNDEYMRKEKASKKRLWPRLLTILLAVASIILFFLFEDMRLPMVYTNQWTICHFVIFVLVVACAIIARFRKDSDEDEGQSQAPQAPQTPAFPQYST